MVLSICIPSYNRGSLAIKRVKELLPALDKYDIELIVSNNGSVNDKDGYDEIASISHPKLKYHAFDKNVYYLGNVIQVLKMAQGDFAMLVSDEDIVIADNLSKYIDFLSVNPEIGVLKATSFMYDYSESEYHKKGIEALNAFYMAGNYVSGVIYNRSIITDALMEVFMSSYCNDNVAWCYYPHMFFDAYALLKGDFACLDTLLIEKGPDEGSPESDSETAEENDHNLLYKYARIDSRLLQMKGFLDQLIDLPASQKIVFEMTIMIINKTIYLCYAVKNIYIKNDYNWDEVVVLIKESMYHILSQSPLPVIKNAISILTDYIDASIETLEN